MWTVEAPEPSEADYVLGQMDRSPTEAEWTAIDAMLAAGTHAGGTVPVPCGDLQLVDCVIVS